MEGPDEVVEVFVVDTGLASEVVLHGKGEPGSMTLSMVLDVDVHEEMYPRIRSRAIFFSAMTLVISFSSRLTSPDWISSGVLGVRRSGMWNQTSRLRVRVLRTMSDQAVRPSQYRSYLYRKAQGNERRGGARYQ